MKIVELKAENVKRLRAVQITPEGNVVIVGGRNGVGKSSLLDSIMYALGGKATVPDQPVRKGQKQAKIVCTLDDVGLVVTRTFTAKGGGSLVVSNAEGAKLPTPQAILDRLTGELTFDPLAFSRDSPRGQLETLKALVNLDFSAMDMEREEHYSARTIVNRDIKELEGQLAGLPAHPDAPADEVSVSELVGKLEEARQYNERNEQVRAKKVRLSATLDEIGKRAKHAEEQIAQWQTILDESTREGAKIRQMLAAGPAIESLEDIDLDPFKQQMETVEATNRRIRENQARVNVINRLTTLNAESSAFTESIDHIDADKAATIAAANLPIDGLTFGEDGVLYNDVPFNQCSSAEQLKVSLAMGMATNPKLRILLIRDGSLLDDESMKIVSEMAKDNEFQIWLERVSDDGAGCSIVIEDGAVKAEAGKDDEK